jgi:GT2 family glycosyltransferase
VAVADLSEGPAPSVAVLVCTRNRGPRIRATIASVLANTYPDFRVVVVDQSSTPETREALTAFSADARLTVISSTATGLSRARNLGLSAVATELVLMTDDDCEVPSDWIARMVDCFERWPTAAIVYCQVAPGPHDAAAGFIPHFLKAGEQLQTRLSDRGTPEGIGAGMALRRAVAETIGGFDPLLGAGSRFGTHEDVDFAVRALLGGLHVLETDRAIVVHHGFRTFVQWRDSTRLNFLGMGAGYGKLLKGGRWSAAPLIAAIAWTHIVRPTFESLVALRMPPVLRRFTGLCSGLAGAFGTPVDRRRLVFIEADRG